MFDGITAGLESLANPWTLLFVFTGALLGMIIGILPGFGPAAAIALLLPVTMNMEPVDAIVMLAGVYYGGMYGGTVTSVLLRIPGDPASMMTVIDGSKMAEQGRGGPALAIAAIGSFAGGTFAVAMLTVLAVPIGKLAVMAGPPEYVAVVLVGLVLSAVVSGGRLSRSLISVGLGLLLAVVGQDPITGEARFTFGSLDLLSGFGIVSMIIGLFGLSEVFLYLERRRHAEGELLQLGRVMVDRDDMKQSVKPIARGSVIGFLIGIIPSGGAMLATVSSYTLERRLSKTPERFGQGAIEGVAGPESANNATSTSAFAPLLTIGIPGSVATALIYGAFILQGIAPGPTLVSDHPEIFWGVILSMYVGNIMLLIMALPLIRIFVKILKIKQSMLFGIVTVLCLVGAYTETYTTYSIWVALAFGVLGYLMKKIGLEPAPLVLAYVLGPIIEEAFRQSMIISGGSLLIFVERPFSAIILALLALAAVAATVQRVRSGRKGLTIGPPSDLPSLPGDQPQQAADPSHHVSRDA